ncbi:hypothetical protein KI387_030081, partial [Taxus chinensis]
KFEWRKKKRAPKCVERGKVAASHCQSLCPSHSLSLNGGWRCNCYEYKSLGKNANISQTDTIK